MNKVLRYTPFLILALMLWTAVPVAAQTFSVAATSAQNSGDINGYIPVDIVVTNLTSGKLNLRVEITEKSQLPEDWETQICFFLNCFPPGSDQIDGEMEANASEALDVTFITGATAATACVEVTVTNLDNTNEKQVLTYCATAGTTSGGSLPTATGIILNQNYPNPFAASKNAATRITYYLPSASPVTLKVYNLLGKEVRTLVNETRAGGRSTVSWDGRDNTGRILPPGVYLYKLTTNSQSITRRLLFTR